nr:cell wall protein DAN4-like [Penaeus vannamei]
MVATTSLTTEASIATTTPKSTEESMVATTSLTTEASIATTTSTTIEESIITTTDENLSTTLTTKDQASTTTEGSLVTTTPDKNWVSTTPDGGFVYTTPGGEFTVNSEENLVPTGQGVGGTVIIEPEISVFPIEPEGSPEGSSIPIGPEGALAYRPRSPEGSSIPTGPEGSVVSEPNGLLHSSDPGKSSTDLAEFLNLDGSVASGSSRVGAEEPEGILPPRPNGFTEPPNSADVRSGSPESLPLLDEGRKASSIGLDCSGELMTSSKPNALKSSEKTDELEHELRIERSNTNLFDIEKVINTNSETSTRENLPRSSPTTEASLGDAIVQSDIEKANVDAQELSSPETEESITFDAQEAEKTIKVDVQSPKAEKLITAESETENLITVDTPSEENVITVGIQSREAENSISMDVDVQFPSALSPEADPDAYPFVPFDPPEGEIEAANKYEEIPLPETPTRLDLGMIFQNFSQGFFEALSEADEISSKKGKA